MSIQRDANIKFHELGTLSAVTRWIVTHDGGVAEWIKNAGRAYQPDRGNVEEHHRTPRTVRSVPSLYFTAGRINIQELSEVPFVPRIKRNEFRR